MLEEFSGQQPIDIDAMFGKQEKKAFVPEATARNKAALTTFLTEDPSSIDSTYNLLFTELKEGNTATADKIKGTANNKADSMTMQAAMSILSDHSIPMEQKQAAIDFIRNKPNYLNDTSVEVATRAASADSPGENKEQEKMRMLNASQALAPVMEYRKEVQGLRNAHAASLDSSTNKAVYDLVETLVPFTTNVNTSKVLSGVLEELKANIGKTKAAILPGSAILAVREALANIPPEKRGDIAKKIMALNSNTGTIISDDNGFQQWITANNIFEEGGYTSTDAFLDNAATLLDAAGLGWVVRAPVRAAKVFKSARNVERASALPGVAPSSAANVVSQVNPDKGRRIFQVVMQGDDEASKALTGVNRDEALTSMVSPQVATVDGEVAARVVEVDRKIINISERIDEAVEGTGGIQYTPGERAKALSIVENKVRDAKDLTVNDAMTTVSADGGKVQINAVYGTSEGGFIRAEDAVAQARLSLREFGITDDNLEILKRDGDVYVPVSKTLVSNTDGDYLVRVKTEHAINPIDIAQGMDQLNVKRNWFDRVPMFMSKTQGSLSRHLLDAISMLDPRIINAAAVATDRATLVDKALLELHEKFAKQFMGLDSDRRSKVYEHIKEANFKGLELDHTQLRAAGFFDEEIKALESWREAWDTHFYLENRDLVRTLQIQNYKVFDNGSDKFFAKEIQKNGNIAHVYDPDSASVVSLTKQELDDLYTQGGHYAQLRRPADIGGQQVEHIIVRNNANSYLRALNNNDQVLNYRKGYYQVHYQNPVFAVKKVRDANGKVLYEKAVAVGGSTPDVEHYIRRQAAADGVSPEDWGYSKYDKRGQLSDSDANWDLKHAEGRIAQRHRGTTLETSDSTIHIGGTEFVADPVESAIRSARSLSGRVATRDVLEVAKQRAIQQYGEFFPEVAGRKMWPGQASDISSNATKDAKKVADARTTWEYLNYLENGYINSMDEGFKAILNSFGQTLGVRGMGTGERAARWLAQSGPTANARSLTFHALIGLNPLRQLLIQPHQIMRMTAYNPKAFLQSFSDISGYLTSKMSGNPISKEAADFMKYIEDSGMLDSVDRHNLVRGTLSDMANSSSTVRRAVGKTKNAVIDTPRKVGFDTGERINLLAHLATVRREAINKGLNVSDKAVRDELYAKARNLSYGMNFAGDMPYNQNFAGVILQFMQVPHKALLQVTTNRGLTVPEKARLAIFDSLMWGIPAVTIAEYLGSDILPDDPKAQEFILFGLESMILNQGFTYWTGDKVSLDFSSLAPYDMTGWGKVIKTLWSEGIGNSLLNTPSGQLYLGNNPRITSAFKKLAGFFGFADDPDMKPEDEIEIAKEFAKISSGMNNAFKAKAIMEIGKRLDSKGAVIDPAVSNIEALGQLFGFGTQDAYQYYEMSKKIKNGSSKHREEVVKYVDEAFKIYTERLGKDGSDPDVLLKVVGTGFRIYKNDYVAQEIIQQELNKRIGGPDDKLLKIALDHARIVDPETMKSYIKQLPLNDEKKKTLLEITEHFQNAKKSLEEIEK